MVQKCEENFQDVLIVIIVFLVFEIEEVGIDNIEDLLSLMLNIIFGNLFMVGNSFIMVCGLLQINNFDQLVVVVVDGVY